MSRDVEFQFVVSGQGLDFKVESFQVTEALSCPFQVSLTVLSPQSGLTMTQLSRQAGVLTLYGQGMGVARVFHGLINDVSYLGEGRRFSRYRLTLVPQLWFLTQRQDCRIFQAQSAPDIIKAVLDDAGAEDYRFELSRDYPVNEYVLQYRETDSHFIQRLLAEHGLWYYFEHSEATHTLVIADSNDAIPELPSTPLNASYLGPLVYHSDAGGVADREHLFDLEQINTVRTGQVTYNDYHYLTPKTPQSVNAVGPSPDTDLALYDYPGRYVAPAIGQHRAQEWQSGFHVDQEQIQASSNIMRLTAGYSMVLSQHPRRAINRDYTLMAVTHHGHNPRVHEEEAGEAPTSYHNQLVCMPRDVTFRAPKMRAPIVDGPQTAVVVGPAGEEIYTDELGRIKVQFHWDRYAQHDEHASCWLRVSQSMAAPNWGAVYLPRIGHEVVVTFLEGDPDRPLVTGAVYNGLHHPPYALPENKTRTVFRTQSHKAKGYNELSFEDEANQEEIYFRAQKDMSHKVLHNRYRDIGQDEVLQVGRHQSNEIHADRKEEIDGHKTSLTKQTFREHVEQDVTVTYNANESEKITNNRELMIDDHRTTQIGKNDTTDIGDNLSQVMVASRSVDIGSDDTLSVGNHLGVEVNGNTSVRSDGQTAVIAADEIKVQVGAAGLVLSSSGTISFYGASILIDGADVAFKGGKVNINPGPGSVKNVAVNTRRPRGPSLLTKPIPEITSATYRSLVEEGGVLQELCQCGKGKTCQLHS